MNKIDLYDVQAGDELTFKDGTKQIVNNRREVFVYCDGPVVFGKVAVPIEMIRDGWITAHRKEPPEEPHVFHNLDSDMKPQPWSGLNETDDDQQEWLTEEDLEECLTYWSEGAQDGELHEEATLYLINKKLGPRSDWMRKGELQRDLNYAEDVISKLKADHADEIDRLKREVADGVKAAIQELADLYQKRIGDGRDRIEAHYGEVQGIFEQHLRGITREEATDE